MALEETLSLAVEFGDLDKLQAELGETVQGFNALHSAALQASTGFDKLTGSAAQAGKIGEQFARNFAAIRLPTQADDQAAAAAAAERSAAKLLEIEANKNRQLEVQAQKLEATLRSIEEKGRQQRLGDAEREALRRKTLLDKQVLDQERAAARTQAALQKATRKAETKALDSDISRINKQLRQMADESRRAGSGLDAFFRQFSSGTASILRMSSAFFLAELGIRTFSQTLQAVNRTIRAGISGAAEEEQAIARLANAMKLTGTASGGALQGLLQLADGLSRTQGVTDDQVIAVQALLVQFGKLKGTELRQATQTTLDLAVALGRSTDEIAELIAKAAQGNVQGLGRLIGRDAIENARSFNDILRILNNTVGGTAAAAAKTASGSLKQLGVAFEELRESIFGAALPGLGEISKRLTEIFQKAAIGFKQLSAVTQGSSVEMLSAFGTMLDGLEQQFGATREIISNELARIETALPEQLRIELESGDLTAALQTLAQMEQVANQSANATDKRFQALFARLREIAREAIPVNVEVRSENLQARFRNVLRELRGEPSLEVLLKGSADFNEAEAAFLGLRAKEEGDPITLAVDVSSPELTALDARLAKLQERITSLAAAAEADPGVEKLLAREQQTVARLIQERERLVQTLREAPATQQFTQQFVAEIRTKLDAAKSKEEMQRILRDLEQQFISLSVIPDSRPVAEGVRQAVLVGRQEIEKNKDLLNVPVELKFVKPQDLAFESALGPMLDLIRSVQEAASVPPGQIFDAAQIIRDADDTTAALSTLDAALDAALERRDLSGLLSTAEALEQFLRATAAAAESDEAIQRVRETVERELARIRGAISAAGPLFQAQDLEIRIQAALDTGAIAEAEALRDRLQGILAENPEIIPQFNLTQLQTDIERAKAFAGPLGEAFTLKARIDTRLEIGDVQGALQTKGELERLLALHPEIEFQVNSEAVFDALLRAKGLTEEFAVAMQAVDAALGVTTTGFTNSWQAAADQVRQIITDLVAFIIKKMAEAAILTLLFPAAGGFFSILRGLFGFKTSIEVIPEPVGNVTLPPVELPVLPPAALLTVEVPELPPVEVRFDVPDDLPALVIPDLPAVALTLVPFEPPTFPALTLSLGTLPDLPALEFVPPPELPEIPGAEVEVRFLLPPLPDFEPLQVPVAFAAPEIPKVQFPRLDFPEIAAPDLSGVFGAAPRVVLPTQEFSRLQAREAAARVVTRPAPTPRPEPETVLRRRSGTDVQVTFEGTFDGESVRRQLSSGAMNRELVRIARRGRP